MSHPVDALWLKIERAEEHLAHFEDLLTGRDGAVKPFRSRAIHYNPERQTTHYETTVTTPKAEWAIVLGDVIHQLRATLDHLICALAMREHPRSVCEDFKLSFPILKDPNDFRADSRVSQGHFARLIGVDELAAVEEAQPYKRNPSNLTGDPLFLLSQLDNIDKHRAILILDNRLAIRSPVGGNFVTTTEEMQPGTKRFRVEFPAHIPPEEMKVEHFAIHIVFAEPSLRRSLVPVGDMLRYIIKNVANIVDDFDRFF